MSIAAFKNQQHRWTKGAVQTARKLLSRLWSSQVPLAVKLEGTLHMTANVAYPLMVGLSVLVVPTMLLRHARGDWWLIWLDIPILLCATGSVGIFFLLAQREVGRAWWRELMRLPALMALGIGISLNNTLAVIEGLGGPAGEFIRTPKHAVLGAGDRLPVARVRTGRDWLVVLEVMFALYFTGSLVVALNLGMWAFVPFLLLFQAGYGYVAVLSVAEQLGARAGTLLRPA